MLPVAVLLRRHVANAYGQHILWHFIMASCAGYTGCNCLYNGGSSAVFAHVSRPSNSLLQIYAPACIFGFIHMRWAAQLGVLWRICKVRIFLHGCTVFVNSS